MVITSALHAEGRQFKPGRKHLFTLETLNYMYPFFIIFIISDLLYCFSRDASQYGGPYLPRQNLLFHGKTFLSTAKLTFSRQNLLFHGKTFFSTAKLTFPRQNLLFHGKTYFSTAKRSFPRQNLLFLTSGIQSLSVCSFPLF